MNRTPAVCAPRCEQKGGVGAFSETCVCARGNQHNAHVVWRAAWVRHAPSMTVRVQEHFYSDILNLHVTSQATEEL